MIALFSNETESRRKPLAGASTVNDSMETGFHDGEEPHVAYRHRHGYDDGKERHRRPTR